ncbi:MAG: hypothetical protein EOP45_04505 [Sphingobacteriaceae bacterium]|nr:MAG: hypothetical protein EOP45_04505 [Sphingobacteriaceae bacterium]
MSNTSNNTSSPSVYTWVLDLSSRVSARSKSVYTLLQEKSVELPYLFRFIFLSFCVCTSKGFLIFNEEVLVALAFVLFLDSFIYAFRDSIQGSLDERIEGIFTELQSTYVVKKRILTESINDLREISTGKDSVFVIDLIRQCGESTKATLLEIERSQKITPLLNGKVDTHLSKSVSFLKNRADVKADLAHHFVSSAYYRAS